MDRDIVECLRNMAWERAKGELYSVLHAYYPHLESGSQRSALVKRKSHTGKAKIQYFQTPDYTKRFEKLDLLRDSDSFSMMRAKKQFETISPKPNGDWLIERNELFQELIPLDGDTWKKFEKHEENAIFVGHSRGFATARDS